MKESTRCTFHHLVGGMKESTRCTFHHLVSGMKMSSFFTWLVIRVASFQIILEYGLYISSPSWWYEGEFLHHLVGENKGKVSRHIVANVEWHKVCWTLSKHSWLMYGCVGMYDVYAWMCWNVWCLCMNVLECMMFMYECVGMYDVYVWMCWNV